MNGIMRGIALFSGTAVALILGAWLVLGCASSRQLALAPIAAATQPAGELPAAGMKISQDVAGVKADASVWAKLTAAAKVFTRDVVITGDDNQVNVGGVWKYLAGLLVALHIRPVWRRPPKAIDAPVQRLILELRRAPPDKAAAG